MTDNDRWGPPRALPDAVREAARMRLEDGMKRSRRRWSPLAATASAAVVALTAGTAVWSTAGDQPSPDPRPDQPPPVTAHPWRVEQPAGQAAGQKTAAEVSAEVVDRCGLDGWTPRWQSAGRGVVLAVFTDGDRFRFCETTPVSVTASDPAEATDDASVAFRTEAGSAAGFNALGRYSLILEDADDRRMSLRPHVQGRVFLAANLFSTGSRRVDVVFDDETATTVRLPAPRPALVDRPRPGRTTAETTACLADAALGTAAPDPGAWSEGGSTVSAEGTAVRTARLDDLVAVCTTDRHGNRSREVRDTGTQEENTPQGVVKGIKSDGLRVDIGLVAAPGAVRATVHPEGYAPVEAPVVNGLFAAVPPAGLPWGYYIPTSVVVHDSTGRVLGPPYEGF